jgi:hypothetical protein
MAQPGCTLTLVPRSTSGGTAMAVPGWSSVDSGPNKWSRGRPPSQQSPLRSQRCEPTWAASNVMPRLETAKAPSATVAGGGTVKGRKTVKAPPS